MDCYKPDDITAYNSSPFGSPLRKYNFTDMNVGFNGMRMDNELSVEGGHLDFGNRIYDSRTGRWMATDKYAGSYPQVSPYTSNGDNPILYIDQNGDFLIPIHERIIKNAFAGTSLKLTDMRKTRAFSESLHDQFLKGLVLGVARPDWRSLTKFNDWTGFNNPLKKPIEELHFDNLDSKAKIDVTWEKINKMSTKIVSDVKSKKLDSFGAGLQLGEVLHNVQDFYSHSNYIELYREYYGSKGKNGDVEVQIYSEAIKDAGFNAYLEDNLVTGHYEAHANKGGVGDYGYDHETDNLDQGKGGLTGIFSWFAEKVTWKSYIAEELATKETAVRLEKFDEELEEK